MKIKLQRISLLCAAFFLASCQGGSNSATNGSNNNIPSPNSVTPSVNIGNITTIPLGQGSSGQSTVTVTNNLNDKLVLTKATYTVTQNGVTSAAISATTSGGAIDASQCASVSPHGTCSLAIRAPENVSQAQYVLNMEYLDSTTGQTYSLSNMVSFSDLVPATDTGVRYSSLNNNVYNVPGNNTTITIPFQLTKDFSSLKVSSNNSNPVFAPSISCSGNTYSAGTLCNLYVTVSGTGSNPLIAGGVTVTGTPLTSTAKTSFKAKSLGSSLKGEVSYLFGVPITVSQNNTGNLITSAINVGVSPSNGTSPQTVTLLNNGAATITNIKVVGATPVSIAPDGCSTLTSGLAVGEQCSFNVDVDSATSGQSTVTVSYNNGATAGNQTGLLVFNVVYIAGASSPGLTITSGQGSLNNVPQNTTQFYNIVVNNTGNATLNNIRFTNPNIQNAAFSWAPGSCSTSGSQSLDAGESCTLVLQYSPTSVASGTLDINAVGTWTGQGGTPQTYAASTLGVAYSSVSGDAFVYITPNYVSYAIRADGQDTATQTFKVVNGGIQSTTLDNILIAPGVTGFTSTGSGAGFCTVGQSLAVNESCIINTVYGPTTTIMTNVESQINVAYKPNGGYSYSVWTFANLVFNSSQAALVTISNISVSGPSSGSGTLLDPYLYSNNPLTPLTINFTYSNTGTAAAESFNVALNNLPIGYRKLPGATCGTGATTSTLAAGDSCTVEIEAVNEYGLYNPYNLSGTGLSFNIPGFSYIDTNTGLNTVQSPTWSGHYGNSNLISVTTSLFATITTTTPTWTTAAAGGTNNFTFTGNNGTIIAIPSDQLNGFTVGNSRKCTISGGSCSISITNVANFPSGTNYFSYYVSPPGTATPAADNSIIQQASFTLN